MSNIKFSMFTPGRSFKQHSPVNKHVKKDNSFRQKRHKSERGTKSPICTTGSITPDNQQSTTRLNISSALPSCTNCGIQGHLNHKCTQPLSSYGVVVVKGNDLLDCKVAMIMRQDSYDYQSLIKNVGIDQTLIKDIARGITKTEKQKLLTKSFKDMWDELYGHTRWAVDSKTSNNRNKVFNMSKDRFDLLNIRSIVYDLNIDALSNEPDWSIPKGKLKNQESWLTCALRELKEEININKHDLKYIDDTPIYHLRTGSDGRSYLTVYYIAILKDGIEVVFKPQYTEIKAVEWKSISDVKTNMKYFPIKEFKTKLKTIFNRT